MRHIALRAMIGRDITYRKQWVLNWGKLYVE